MASRHLALDFYMGWGCIIRVNPVRAKLEFEYALCFLITGKNVFLNRDVPCMLSCNCGFWKSCLKKRAVGVGSAESSVEDWCSRSASSRWTISSSWSTSSTWTRALAVRPWTRKATSSRPLRWAAGGAPGWWWWWWWWWWLQGQHLVGRDSSWRSRHHGSDPALGRLSRVERTDDVHARLFSSWRALTGRELAWRLPFFDFETEQNFEDAKTCSGSLITAPVNLCISLTLPPPLPMILPTWMSTSSTLAVT